MNDKEKVLSLEHLISGNIGPLYTMGWEAGIEVQRDADWERVKALVEACRFIVAVGNCMMLQNIHDEFSVQEMLGRYGAASVQLLAKMAEDKAREALALLDKGEKP